jgi:excinuclease ABC subunit A
MASDSIIIRGAKQHNLKNIDLEIPRDRLVVITGLSGSGKSSLAFDTIYAEGQRRYVESLSAYARQFLELAEKPEVESIEGLSPAISIEQKAASKNPRSTVGTVTEIYDYLRLLFARVGHPHCWKCGKEIKTQTVQQIVDQLMSLPQGIRFHILAPIARQRKGEYKKELNELRKQGYVRVKVDGGVHDLGEDIRLDKKKKHDIDVFVDRLVLKKEKIERRLADSLEIALKVSEGLVKVELPDKKETMTFSEKFACPDCGVSYPEISPRMFSFNSPYGACERCDGLGTMMYFDPDLIVPNPDLSLREGAILPWERRQSIYFYQMLNSLARHYDFDINTPFKKIPRSVQKVLLYGSGDEELEFRFDGAEAEHSFSRTFEGIIPNLDRRFEETGSDSVREEIQRYMNIRPCPDCGGTRLKPESLNVKVGGKNIAEVASLSIKQAKEFFDSLTLSRRETEIARRILKEIRERLGFLSNVGLSYLTLDRASATLAGGEAQRIRLATQIGSGLMGVLYILDEPSVGLHPRDHQMLLNTLCRLRDLGNTILVVEHDEATIRQADHVIDMGPGAGVRGGRIVAQGAPEEIMAHLESLTGAYLSGRMQILIPGKRRLPGKESLVIKGARENNLKKIEVRFPLGLFICITGVSGSGKSTLVVDTLYRVLAQKIYHSKERAGQITSVMGLKYLDRVIDIDQSAIGRTPRSNPATYTGLFTHIRDLFAKLPESRIRGYKPGRFSFNVKGGRCEACEGDGTIKIEMHFLPDIYVTCDVCRGSRYNRETLQVTYKGKNIADVLDLTVDEAYELLKNIPPARSKLQTLKDVGLGYIQLGQSAPTLSGGEAQRIKLSRELSKRATGRTMYILDEPTTGLHFDDIQKLLNVLTRLVDQGNTVIVIEHNMEVIKTADWIIDLGPEGGEEGGEIIAQGTPEDVAACPESYTGQYLHRILGEGRIKKASGL